MKKGRKSIYTNEERKILYKDKSSEVYPMTKLYLSLTRDDLRAEITNLRKKLYDLIHYDYLIYSHLTKYENERKIKSRMKRAEDVYKLNELRDNDSEERLRKLPEISDRIKELRDNFESLQDYEVEEYKKLIRLEKQLWRLKQKLHPTDIHQREYITTTYESFDDSEPSAVLTYSLSELGIVDFEDYMCSGSTEYIQMKRKKKSRNDIRNEIYSNWHYSDLSAVAPSGNISSGNRI